MIRGVSSAPVRKSLISASVLVLTCGLGSGVLAAQTKASAKPAAASSIAPKLAAGVKPQAGYEPVQGRWVVGNPTPIYTDIMETSPTTGETGGVNSPVDTIAKVKDYDWFLVGRGGEGIGYVPRDLLKPAGGAKT